MGWADHVGKELIEATCAARKLLVALQIVAKEQIASALAQNLEEG